MGDPASSLGWSLSDPTATPLVSTPVLSVPSPTHPGRQRTNVGDHTTTNTPRTTDLLQQPSSAAGLRRKWPMCWVSVYQVLASLAARRKLVRQLSKSMPRVARCVRVASEGRPERLPPETM